MPPPLPGSGKGKGPKPVLIIVTVIVVIAAVVAGGLFFLRGTPEVEQVALEKVSYAGPNPFTVPVGTDAPAVKTVVGSGGMFAGDTPGLYGQSGDTPSCDVMALNADLQATPAKATAWAEALGLTAADIPAYTASLTPVVLRADTSVTEHSFEGGTFSPYPAVLQAGTALFINSYGEPKVKCFSGNPLTRPLTTDQEVGYTGPPWAGFTPMQVTVVNRPVTVIKIYTVVDVHTGKQSSRPGKGPGPDDGKGYCDKNPTSEKCKPITTNPNSPLGPAPAKGCAPSDDGKNYICPAGADPTQKPAPNCTLTGTNFVCPPMTTPTGQGGLTPDQVMQVCTVSQGGCKGGKPSPEQQCKVLPMTCTNGVPNAPAGGPAGPAGQKPVLTPEQAAQICPPNINLCVGGKPTTQQQCAAFPDTCTNGVPNANAPAGAGAPPNGPAQAIAQPRDALTDEQVNSVCSGPNQVFNCPGGKPNADQQCAAFPATCTVPNPPAGNGTPGAVGEKAPSRAVTECRAILGPDAPGCKNLDVPADNAPSGMIVGPGMGTQASPCMFMTETCPAGTPGVVQPGTPANPGTAGAPVQNGGTGAKAGPGPCPAVPDPARPECKVATDPAPGPTVPGPGTDQSGPAGGGGTGGGTTPGGGSSGDTGGQGGSSSSGGGSGVSGSGGSGG